ncbi:MAG: NAD-dependent epimerase/dehydratase family protein [Verrucomicrobiota bacterium]
MKLSNTRVLVTGATGFIGGRLIERLILQEGAAVTALVRHFKRASRLARFDVQMKAGDVTDIESLRHAAKDCDYIVHCAVSFTSGSEGNRAITVDGTRNVCQVARELNVKGVAHLSTVSVYGNPPAGPLTEESPAQPSDDYGRNKLDAEKIVADFRKEGLPVTILRPTIVYGPWSFWSTFPAAQLERGRVILPNGGDTVCNAVYVDDVITAILLGLDKAKSHAGPYLISAEKPVTWSEFFARHGAILEDSEIVPRPLSEIWSHNQRQKHWGGLIRAWDTARHHQGAKSILLGIPGIGHSVRTAKRLFPQKMKQLVAPEESAAMTQETDKILPRELIWPIPEHLDVFANQATVSINAAKQDLGYRPDFTFEQGIELTNSWARWTRSLVSSTPND